MKFTKTTNFGQTVYDATPDHSAEKLRIAKNRSGWQLMVKREGDVGFEPFGVTEATKRDAEEVAERFFGNGAHHFR